MSKLRIDRRITESEVRFCMKQLVITLKKIKRILNINLLVSEFIYEKKIKIYLKTFWRRLEHTGHDYLIKGKGFYICCGNLNQIIPFFPFFIFCTYFKAIDASWITGA